MVDGINTIKWRVVAVEFRVRRDKPAILSR